MEKIHLILASIQNLQKDFIGYSFRPELFLKQVVYFIFVLFIFYILYGVGKFVNRLLFRDYYDSRLSTYISFALGYLVVATSIYILGFASQLTAFNVLFLLFLFFLIAITDFIKYPVKISIGKINSKPDIFKLLAISFLIIGFLRLIPPQTAGDPLDYHLRFPRVYLAAHSMMIPALGDESYTTVPHLPEMLYVPTQIISNGWISHVVSYGFFLLIFFLLYNVNYLNKKEKNIGVLASLMFVSAPLMLQLGTQAFSDFPAIFCFMLSCYLLLQEKINRGNIVLSGILIGAALASKIWILYYFPFVVLFLFLVLRRKKFKQRSREIGIFILSAIVVVLPWYVRGYLLVGNPFYVNTSDGQISQTYSQTANLIRNFTPMGFLHKFHFSLEYGIILYLGFVVGIFIIRKLLKAGNKKFYLLLVLLLVAALVLPLSFLQGRYSLPYMLLLYLVSAYALSFAIKRNMVRYFLVGIFVFSLFYFLLNTLITLPYGLGWASKDNFLRRNLVMDVSAYYDYNGQFTRNISSRETLLTFGVYQMYYANFNYKNIFYYIDQKTRIFAPPQNLKKLLIRGGDFSWMCKTASIKNCEDFQVKPVTADLNAKQYLYKIEYASEK